MGINPARAGIAQLARARAFQARGRGFESRFPLQITKMIAADVAQSVERILGKDEVTSSILVIGSTFQVLPLINTANSDAKRSNNAGVRSMQPAKLHYD